MAKYQRLQRGKNGLIESFEMASFVIIELKTMSNRLVWLIWQYSWSDDVTHTIHDNAQSRKECRNNRSIDQE